VAVRQGGVFAFAFLWFRASFPRYRYDQIMRLGWKVFIPITLAWIFFTAVAAYNNWFVLGPETMTRVFSYLKSLMLIEFLRAWAHAQVHVQAEVHGELPVREVPAVAALPRPARAAPLPERRRALHRLQAVRGGVPGAGDHHRRRAARGRHAPHHALRHRPVQVHLLRLLRGKLPGRLDRRDAHPRVPLREPRREHRHKAQLLALGDRFEAEIASRRAADAAYR
jgi:hypothetical protein